VFRALDSRPVDRFALDHKAESKEDHSHAEKDYVQTTNPKEREKRNDQGDERNAEEEHTPESCLLHANLLGCLSD
jgi:hypothetical protein